MPYYYILIQNRNPPVGYKIKYIFMVQGIKSEVLCILGKDCHTELYLILL
jgi:hypothetical protein